jgi:hypothetical protein
MSIHSDVPKGIHVPARKIRVTPDVIAMSNPEDYAGCLIATALRMRLGARSVYVTSDFIKFNAPGVDEEGVPYTNADGTPVMVRYCYQTPRGAGAKAESFDAVFRKDGAVAAREAAKPFEFILQSGDGFARPVQSRRGEGRTATRIRRATDAPRVCKRRYHGHTTFSVENSDLTPAEKALHADPAIKAKLTA